MNIPTGDTTPLVSCIMPTHNRRRFISRSLSYFMGQDYPHCELIIVDDGSDSVRDLVPDDPRIVYLYIDKPVSLGAKRNLACENASGSIIMHWDDDDWMANWRISYQVRELLASGADICGLNKLLFYDPVVNLAWLYTYPNKPGPLLAGGSLCYQKQYWHHNRFAKLNIGEDAQFIWSDVQKQIKLLDNEQFYIAITHSSNSCKRTVQGRRWSPRPVAGIVKLLGDDATYYSTLSVPVINLPQPSLNLAVPELTPVSADLPLISCIMPTRNRPMFIPLALEYFEAQDYPHKELIIVDDGESSIADSIPVQDNIIYIRLETPQSLGHKRNVAVRHSRGSIIAHWDDDDWYAADRLSHQVQPLIQGAALISGYQIAFFFQQACQCFWQITPQLHKRMFQADVHGRSLMYERSLWHEDNIYPDVSVGDDSMFLRRLLEQDKQQVTLARLCGKDKVISVRHKDNTWRFDCGTYLEPSQWRRVSVPLFMPDLDQCRYPLLPLVSCIMPTYNRRHFVSQAIEYFLRQDYVSRELIIVDDGSDPIGDLLPNDPRLIYIKMEEKLSIGAKRNIACEHASGDIIMLWDDDDWYSKHRISHQVNPLISDRADVTGFSDCVMLSLSNSEFWSCDSQLNNKLFFEGVVGGSLAFRKSYWQQGIRFRDISLGEDAQYLRLLLKQGARLEKIANAESFIYIRHCNNSWVFSEGHYMGTVGWSQVSVPSFLPSLDCRFYKL